MAKDDEKTLMSPGEMKPLLLLSKREPVNCALGITKDKTGVLLLDKKLKPRKLFGMMKTEAAKAKIEMDMGSVRYGKAAVDTGIDSSLVTFTVNKSPGGTLRPMILAQLKKAGFSKCEIIVDEKIDDEPDDAEEGETQEAAAPAQGATAQQDAFVQQAMGISEQDGPAQAAQAGDAQAQPAAAQDAPAQADAAGAAPEQDDGGAALKKRLTDLVKQMMAGMGANPAGADAMKTAAVAAQTALKSGDVATATQSADTLERLLTAASNAGGAGGADAKGPAMGSPVFAKARATWVATQKKVESELDKLHAELQSVYKGHGVVADLEKSFRSTVEPTMSKFDGTLADKLDEVNKNTDPGAHAKLVSEVQDMITQYESFLSSDPLIAQLDDNPFVPLSIEKTLTMSLSILSKSVN